MSSASAAIPVAAIGSYRRPSRDMANAAATTQRTVSDSRVGFGCSGTADASSSVTTPAMRNRQAYDQNSTASHMSLPSAVNTLRRFSTWLSRELYSHVVDIGIGHWRPNWHGEAPSDASARG